MGRKRDLSSDKPKKGPGRKSKYQKPPEFSKRMLKDGMQIVYKSVLEISEFGNVNEFGNRYRIR
jgi:hypothetical protein